MGIIKPYFPKDLAVKMAEIANAETFVETGTFYGNTTKWASTAFKTVFTIELSEYIYNEIKDELQAKGNITPIFGDSKQVLPGILENISGNIVFWLDGHYSAGDTAGADDPCPLRQELKTILKRNNDDIIFIDDARCMAGEEGYPTMVEIYRIVNETAGNKRYVQLCDDHIYIVPDKEEYKESLCEYTLAQNILLWQMRSEKWDKDKLKTTLYVFLIDTLKKIKLYKVLKKIVKGKR